MCCCVGKGGSAGLRQSCARIGNRPARVLTIIDTIGQWHAARTDPNWLEKGQQAGPSMGSSSANVKLTFHLDHSAGLIRGDRRKRRSKMTGSPAAQTNGSGRGILLRFLVLEGLLLT